MNPTGMILGAMLILAACGQEVVAPNNTPAPIPETASATGNIAIESAPAEFDKTAETDEDIIVADQDIRARRNAESEVKIYDGTPVPPATYLATVGLLRPGETYISCTGSLIRSNMVLTAAHCVCGRGNGRVYVGTDPSFPTGPKSGRYYDVQRIEPALSCPAYLAAKARRQSSTILRPYADLAVLRLSRPVPNTVTPVTFAGNDLVTRAKSFRVVGFGAIDQDGEVFTNEKREASVTAVSNGCVGRRDGLPDGETDRSYYGCQPEQEIVAGQRRSPDTCSGDSGGPLLITPNGNSGTGSSDRFLLAGVTSRPIQHSERACGFGGIYERLTPTARAWIDSAIRKLRTS